MFVLRCQLFDLYLYIFIYFFSLWVNYGVFIVTILKAASCLLYWFDV